jgi:hypothetical protein
MTLDLATRDRPRRRSNSLRTALVGAAALLCWALAGCGDPDDDGGGGGGGYVSHQSAQHELG